MRLSHREGHRPESQHLGWGAKRRSTQRALSRRIQEHEQRQEAGMNHVQQRKGWFPSEVCTGCRDGRRECEPEPAWEGHSLPYLVGRTIPFGFWGTTKGL